MMIAIRVMDKRNEKTKKEVTAESMDQGHKERELMEVSIGSLAEKRTECSSFLQKAWISALLVSTNFGGPALAKHLDFTDSISQSKKQGTFVRTVPVQPDQFIWDGHQAAVAESWLDHFPEKGDYLSFRLKFDNGRYREESEKDGKQAFLKEEGEPSDSVDRPKFFYIVRPHNLLVGGTSGVVHYLQILPPEPETINLRVGMRSFTVQTMPKRRVNEHESLSDTVLTFRLSNP